MSAGFSLARQNTPSKHPKDKASYLMGPKECNENCLELEKETGLLCNTLWAASSSPGCLCGRPECCLLLGGLPR